MPFSITTLRCRLDPELDAALFSYQERLGDQLISARAQLDVISALGASVTSAFSDPMRRSLDALLATADTSTEAVMDATLMVVGDSVADVEAAITDRFDLTVVGGRLILPGTSDLSPIQTFARVLGGFEEIFRVLPDLAGIVGSDSDTGSYAPSPLEITTRLVMVTTYLKRTITPATSCTPEIVVETEVTIGVDLPVLDSLASAGITEESLRIYLFWIGRPQATAATRSKSRLLGLTNAQFVDAVSVTSRENFFVSVIRDPVDIARVDSAFGDDATETLGRLTGPVSLFPSPEDMAALIRDSLRSSFPGSAGPSGLPDFSSPALSLLTVLDIDKTFRLDDLAASMVSQGGGTDAASQFAEAMGNAIRSQLAVISTIIREAQAVITGVLNQVVGLTSLVNMLLNDLANGLMDCLLGSSFSPAGSFASIDIGIGGIGGIGGAGSPGTPGASSSNPLDSILSLIEDQSSLITDFFRSISSLLGIVSDVSCSGGFTSSAVSSMPSFGGPIPCQADAARAAGFELPVFMQESLGITKVVMDVLTSLFDTVRTTMRGLRVTVNSLSLSLRLSLSRRSSAASASSLPSPPGSPGCASPQATRLAALLVQRSIEAFTPSV